MCRVTHYNEINSNEDINDRIRASIIQNGDGYMLRIESTEGRQLEIAETVGGGVLEKLNISPSSCGYAAVIAVRSDIVENANKIACGSPDFEGNKGTYTISAASNKIANKLADVFKKYEKLKDVVLN